MPEGFGYGGDEVKATTHNKTLKKKATSQNPPQSTLATRAQGETPQQKQFRKQVKSQVGDTSTQKDVLKAAGLKQLPGAGISSTTRAPGIGQKDTRKYDEVDRAIMRNTPPPAGKEPKVSRAVQQRKHPGLQRMVDSMRAAGLSEQKINQYLSVQYSAGPGTERRAERREKFLRRQAAEKYGTPP